MKLATLPKVLTYTVWERVILGAGLWNLTIFADKSSSMTIIWCNKALFKCDFSLCYLYALRVVCTRSCTLLSSIRYFVHQIKTIQYYEQNYGIFIYYYNIKFSISRNFICIILSQIISNRKRKMFIEILFMLFHLFEYHWDSILFFLKWEKLAF